jgi:hypothetical protein
MTTWSKPIGKMPRLKPFPLPAWDKQTSVAFPLCSMRGGLCDTLLTALPLAIIGIQFIRDESGAVQDGLVTFANACASAVFAPDILNLTGALFLTACGEALPDGGWQSCLWVASSGKPDTILQSPGNAANPPRFLTIAPYGDGLILCRSLG